MSLQGPDAGSLRDRLARSVTYAGMRGVVEGRVLEELGTISVGEDERYAQVFTRYSFEVVRVVGQTGGSLYRASEVVELLVPGGTTGGLRVAVQDAPDLSVGDHLLVWIQTDTGDLPLAVDAQRLIVLTDGNVAKIQGDVVDLPMGVSAPYDEVIDALNSAR